MYIKIVYICKNRKKGNSMSIKDILELDKTKYFLSPNKEKIYALKGEGHDRIAERIIDQMGLNDIYIWNEYSMTRSLFLTYCGYVLVDEGEKKCEPKEFGMEYTEFALVVYCSASISEEYIGYLKNVYGKKGNQLEDSYELIDENRMNEIMKRVKQKREEIQQDNEREF